jgi:hypothetical protein
MIHLIGAVDDMAAAVRARDGIVALVVGDTTYVGLPVRTAPAPDMASLCRHDGAVIDLMAACTVVPFQFGTVVSGAADLEAKLGGRGEHMPALLKRLRGRREVSLRAGFAQPRRVREGSSASGTAYLRARREPDELTELHNALAVRAVDALSNWDAPRRLFKASYLVELADVAAFAGAASRRAAAYPAISAVSLTGPWAPYSFARLSVSTAEAVRA